MNNKQEYHELYGWIPTDIVNKISEIDRQRIFLNWLMKEPSDVGVFMTKVILNALGDNFIKYIIQNIITVIREDYEEITEEAVVNSLETILSQFAVDQNIMMQYIEEYCENTGVDIKSINLNKKADQPRDPKTGRFMKK